MNILEARIRLLGRNVYKRTTEGNPAIAQGSLARMYPGIEMQGWTEQAQYEGKNLFDRSSFAKAPSSGGVVSIPILLKRNTQYVFSDNYGEWSGTGLYLFISSDGAQDGRNEFLINSNLADRKTYVFTTDDSENFYLCTYTNNVSIILESASEIQIEEGSVATTYEPYTGGQPSPNPDYPQEIVSAGKYDEGTGKYEYEVKLTGKNLWNAEEAADKSNWVASTSQRGYSDFAIEVKPGEKVTFSFPEKLPLGIIMYVAIVSVEDGSNVKWLYHSTLENLIVQQATVTAITDKIWVRCNTGSIKKFVQDNPYFQVEYGEERTDFQPYKEQTVALTSDRPLTKWDRLEKRNGVWGWVYKSGSYTMTGNEGFISSGDRYHGEETSNAWIINNDMYSEKDYEEIVRGYCERLRRVYNVWSIDRAVGFTYNINQIHIRLNNTDTGVTEEDTLTDVANKIKAYVAQQYEEGNPFVFWYETEEETFVPLSETEQEALNALHTFRPTTVLSNDCECEMTLTYKTKKSMQSAPGGGILKADDVTSEFIFPVKWNQVNKIVLKISGISSNQSIFVCGANKQNIWIGLDNEGVMSMNGLKKAVYNGAPENEIVDGKYHEMIFTFEKPVKDTNISNIWDWVWSKNIIYHEIMFYDDDELLSDCVPYYKGAGYMLDKKNNIVIRASDPDAYQFA